MFKKINNIDMLAQMLLIVLIALILATLLFAIVFYPLINTALRANIFSSMSNATTVSRDINSYHNNNSYALISYSGTGGQGGGIYSISDNTNNLVSNTAKFTIMENLSTSLIENGNYVNTTFRDKVLGDRIYVRYFKIDGVMYAILTTNEVYSKSNYNIYTLLIISMSMAFFIPFILLFIWSFDMRTSIDKVNNFLLNYENDYKNVNFSNKQLNELVSNFYNYHERITSKEQEKQILFQNISHELKTPITTIKMYAEGIEDGLYKNNDINESADVIISQTNELLAKVSKIMQINRLSHIELANKNSLNNEKIILSDVLFDVLNRYADRAPYVKFNVELDKVVFRGTKDIWQNIFENIFDNNIRHKATEINISLSDNYLIIENNGELIEEEVLSNIFEPFTKGEGGSYGLGMSIIKRSLEVYKYKIKIYNTDKSVIYMIME